MLSYITHKINPFAFIIKKIKNSHFVTNSQTKLFIIFKKTISYSNLRTFQCLLIYFIFKIKKSFLISFFLQTFLIIFKIVKIEIKKIGELKCKESCDDT
jgi:hypothetical protein